MALCIAALRRAAVPASMVARRYTSSIVEQGVPAVVNSSVNDKWPVESKALKEQRFALTPDKPQPMSAMELIHEQPIKVVNKNKVVSGGGPTGHPITFLNLDQDKVVMCPYSGDFYVRKGALDVLLKRGAVLEKDGLFYKNINVTDEE